MSLLMRLHAHSVCTTCDNLCVCVLYVCDNSYCVCMVCGNLLCMSSGTTCACMYVCELRL